MAGGSLRGSPSHCRRLSEGSIHPFRAHLYYNLLRLHLSFCAKPAPGCTCREPRCCPDYNSIMEPHLCPQNPRPTLERHTLCSDSFGLATRALRPYDAKSCSRGSVIRSVREPTSRLTTRDTDPAGWALGA